MTAQTGAIALISMFVGIQTVLVNVILAECNVLNFANPIQKQPVKD